MIYEPGKLYPPAQVRGPAHGPEWPPTWLALTVAPQKERATRDHLRLKGIPAFYPSHEIIRTQFGKKVATERPFVSGYVFAKFKQQPDWDYLKRVHRLITGVVSRGNIPFEIHPAVIDHMRGLTVEADKLAAARAEMLKIKKGDRAAIESGPLAGFTVEIMEVKNRDALVSLMMGGKPITVSTATLRKV